MRKIKLIFDNGDYLITRVVMTDDEIYSYYLGKKFCFLDNYDDAENLITVVRIKFLN